MRTDLVLLAAHLSVAVPLRSQNGRNRPPNIATAAAAVLVGPLPARAYSGSGASATGQGQGTVATRLQLRKSYQLRVAADVRDFNSLGESLARGESVDKSGAWVYFFSQYERREADEFGRKCTALADLNGHKGEGRELEGGCGFLLAATFSKAGNPPDNTPAVRSYIALIEAFDPIQKAGEKGKSSRPRQLGTKLNHCWKSTLRIVKCPLPWQICGNHDASQEGEQQSPYRVINYLHPLTLS